MQGKCLDCGCKAPSAGHPLLRCNSAVEEERKAKRDKTQKVKEKPVKKKRLAKAKKLDQK